MSKPQLNYTTNDNKLLAIVEFLKQFQRILFGYEINIFSYHKNLVYATTLSESQRVVLWILILKEFGPNIQHISVVDNIVADTLSRFPSTHSNKYNHFTRKAQYCANESFALGRIESNEEPPPLNFLIVQREK